MQELLLRPAQGLEGIIVRRQICELNSAGIAAAVISKLRSRARLFIILYANGTFPPSANTAQGKGTFGKSTKYKEEGACPFRFCITVEASHLSILIHKIYMYF